MKSFHKIQRNSIPEGSLADDKLLVTQLHHQTPHYLIVNYLSVAISILAFVMRSNRLTYAFRAILIIVST